MRDRRWYVENRSAYMTLGDVDKPFHRPECSCPDCEAWRRRNDRPTHAELSAMPAQEPPR